MRKIESHLKTWPTYVHSYKMSRQSSTENMSTVHTSNQTLNWEMWPPGRAGNIYGKLSFNCVPFFWHCCCINWWNCSDRLEIIKHNYNLKVLGRVKEIQITTARTKLGAHYAWEILSELYACTLCNDNVKCCNEIIISPSWYPTLHWPPFSLNIPPC